MSCEERRLASSFPWGSESILLLFLGRQVFLNYSKLLFCVYPIMVASFILFLFFPQVFCSDHVHLLKSRGRSHRLGSWPRKIRIALVSYDVYKLLFDPLSNQTMCALGVLEKPCVGV